MGRIMGNSRFHSLIGKSTLPPIEKPPHGPDERVLACHPRLGWKGVGDVSCSVRGQTNPDCAQGNPTGLHEEERGNHLVSSRGEESDAELTNGLSGGSSEYGGDSGSRDGRGQDGKGEEGSEHLAQEGEEEEEQKSLKGRRG